MDISVHFQEASVKLGSTQALRRISVDVPAGKIVGLLGPSGAGKTTLMRVIAGRQRLDSGTAMILGRPAGSPRLRGTIGYMPQTAAIYHDLTVMENMRYFAAMLGVVRNEAQQRLQQVDLTGQAGQIVSTLSGGQKSRVSLAIALLGNPELLVLDEPTVGVDPILRQQLWRIFHDVARAGTTVFVSSHVMDEASRCDDLLLIRNGELLAHDTPAGLCRRTHTESVEEAFLSLVGEAS